MIGINNLTTNEIDESFIEKVAEIIFKGENIKEGDLSVVFLGAGRMRKLNKKYRKKNKVTDVLSFEPSKKFPAGPEKELGEVVICLQEVKKSAKRLNFDYNKELARIFIHGLLHLLGYDHEKGEKEAKKMEKKQESYLAQI